MFLDLSNKSPHSRSSGAQCLRPWICETGYVSLLRSEENLLELPLALAQKAGKPIREAVSEPGAVATGYSFVRSTPAKMVQFSSFASEATRSLPLPVLIRPKPSFNPLFPLSLRALW